MRIDGRQAIVAITVLALALMIAACAGGGVARRQPSTVAIWDIVPLGTMDAAQSGMGAFLSNRIIARFDDDPRHAAIDRSKLDAILEELNLGSSDLADPGTRLRLGRLLGAQRMVFGAYQVVAATMRIDLRLVDVATGRIERVGVGTSPAGDTAGWIKAADQAAGELLD
jgi:hypothetical protein